MSTVAWVAVGLAVWALAGGLLAIVIGRAVRLREERAPAPSGTLVPRQVPTTASHPGGDRPAASVVAVPAQSPGAGEGAVGPVRPLGYTG